MTNLSGKLPCLLVISIVLICCCEEEVQEVNEVHEVNEGETQEKGQENILEKDSENSVPVYTYEILNVYPHDAGAFTQGLVFEDGFLYEGTGLSGESSLRKVELETGKVLKMYVLPAEFFGEGITLYKDKIIQITWQSHKGFVYSKETFELLGEFTYPTEGWGLTCDGERLIMSDGTSRLHFLDLETFEEIKQVHVHDSTGFITRINELEYIDGEIYANIWQEDVIARISPETGEVTGWIDLTGLLSPAERGQADVLNGIAYDRESDRLFVTGKFWPYLFEIRLVPSHLPKNEEVNSDLEKAFFTSFVHLC